MVSGLKGAAENGSERILTNGGSLLTKPPFVVGSSPLEMEFMEASSGGHMDCVGGDEIAYREGSKSDVVSSGIESPKSENIVKNKIQ